MKWTVRCTCSDCFLHTEQIFGDLAVAETLAYVHEQRWANDDRAHVVMLQEYKPVQSSVERQTGKGMGVSDA